MNGTKMTRRSIRLNEKDKRVLLDFAEYVFGTESRPQKGNAGEDENDKKVLFKGSPKR